MEKIKIKRLSDEEECQTATEVKIKDDIITNSAIEIISKINELVEENGELKRRLDNHINNHKEYGEGGRPVPK